MPSKDDILLSVSIHDWIVRVILDDCMYTDLNLDDQKTRDAVVEGLKSAANYFDSYNKTLH